MTATIAPPSAPEATTARLTAIGLTPEAISVLAAIPACDWAAAARMTDAGVAAVLEASRR